MYERFYNLRERPFALSPDPEYLYLSRVHSEALDSIRYGIESCAGFIVVTGEIGAGKTTLLQTMLQRLDNRAVIARVVNTMLEPRELLEAIALDFGLNDISQSKPALVRDLGLFLVEQRRQGRRPLVVIDEAQNLSPLALEEVRLLSNLETEKSKLLQIVLAGQPNLRDTIATPELEQFRQRVAVSYHLMPLEPSDTAAYINFRLEHAALGEPLRFPPDACNLVHEISGGVPRIINVVCDAALVFGYAEERHTIDGAMIDEVVTELEETGIVRRAPRPAAGGPEKAAATPAPVAGALECPGQMPPPAPSSQAATPAKPGAPGRTLSEPQTAAPLPLPDNLWRRVAAPAANPATSPVHTSGAAATTEQPQTRDLSLAAARDAALQATQLSSAREMVAAEREDLLRKQRDLAAREQTLMERERQIAEQRRIMGEEYRLMRQAQSARSAVTPGPRSSVAMNHAKGVDASANDIELTLWQRLSRLLAWSPAVRS